MITKPASARKPVAILDWQSGLETARPWGPFLVPLVQHGRRCPEWIFYMLFSLFKPVVQNKVCPSSDSFSQNGMKIGKNLCHLMGRRNAKKTRVSSLPGHRYSQALGSVQGNSAIYDNKTSQHSATGGHSLSFNVTGLNWFEQVYDNLIMIQNIEDSP